MRDIESDSQERASLILILFNQSREDERVLPYL